MSTLLFKTIDGKFFKIKVDLSKSIDFYQKLLDELTSIRVVDQRLIYGGKQLETSNSFKKYGIQEGSTIHVIERLPSSRQRELNELQKQARSVKIPYCEEIHQLQKLDDLNKQEKMSAIKLALQKVRRNILRNKVKTLELTIENKELEKELSRLTQ